MSHRKLSLPGRAELGKLDSRALCAPWGTLQWPCWVQRPMQVRSRYEQLQWLQLTTGHGWPAMQLNKRACPGVSLGLREGSSIMPAHFRGATHAASTTLACSTTTCTRHGSKQSAHLLLLVMIDLQGLLNQHMLHCARQNDCVILIMHWLGNVHSNLGRAPSRPRVCMSWQKKVTRPIIIT